MAKDRAVRMDSEGPIEQLCHLVGLRQEAPEDESHREFDDRGFQDLAEGLVHSHGPSMRLVHKTSKGVPGPSTSSVP